MCFFEFLFRKKVMKSYNEQQPSYNQDNTLNNKPIDSGTMYVEQYVKESIEDLKKHTKLSTKVLEAEAIYLAAFLYMKGSFQIDFDIDYFSDGLLDKIPSGDYSVSDEVFSYMMKYGEGYYCAEERDYGINGYKMNIQHTPDYGSYIKNYFIRAHKIESGKDFILFSSPRNCLWKSGVKSIESPTQRDIYYKFIGNNFELMIPPYNPLVTGRIVGQTATTLRCQSNDGRRTFVFHYDGAIKQEFLNYIEMFRNDKCDMVSYHKTLEERKAFSLEDIISRTPHHLKFKKMLCTMKKASSKFGGMMFIIEDPLEGSMTADMTIDNGNVVIEFPRLSLINERGGLNIKNKIHASGAFVKEDSDYAPICYHMHTDMIDIQIFQKSDEVFSFISIPTKSSRPDYCNFDTLFIELDLLQS